MFLAVQDEILLQHYRILKIEKGQPQLAGTYNAETNKFHARIGLGVLELDRLARCLEETNLARFKAGL